MKKYDDYKSDKSDKSDKTDRDLTKEEISSIDWTRYKIVVPNEKDKKELIGAFEILHNSNVDTDYITVNQLVHEYLTGDNILVNKKLYDSLK